LWDGRVQWAGINPYRYPPAADVLAALRDPVIHPGINRSTKRTVYPPGAEAVFAAVAAVAPGSLLGWRLFLLACEAVTAGLLLGLLRRQGAPSAAVLLYAWAPLAVLEGGQAGHLEFVLIPVLLLALRWRQAGRMGAAGILLGAAVLLKLYPAALVLAWWRRGDRRLPLACAAVVGAGYLPYAWSVGSGVTGFLPEYFGSTEDFNIGLRWFLTGWIPVGSAAAREALRGVTMLALFAALAGVLIGIARRRREDPEGVLEAGMAAVAAYLVLVPTAMHAWYAAWILPFLVVRRSPAWLWFTGAVSLSYLKYLAEPGELPSGRAPRVTWGLAGSSSGSGGAGLRLAAPGGPAAGSPASRRWRRSGTARATPACAAIGLAYLAALVGLAVYGLNAYVMLGLHWWSAAPAGVAPGGRADGVAAGPSSSSQRALRPGASSRPWAGPIPVDGWSRCWTTPSDDDGGRDEAVVRLRERGRPPPPAGRADRVRAGTWRPGSRRPAASWWQSRRRLRPRRTSCGGPFRALPTPPWPSCKRGGGT
jgi:hypothetical protein